MLEQLCSDVTGWPGMAVEYFTRLSTTQYVRNHLRLDNAIVDVHSPMTATDIGSAFDLPPRTRRRPPDRHRPGPLQHPNIGLFVWRLASVRQSPATRRCQVGTNQYTFDPFGGDVPARQPARGDNGRVRPARPAEPAVLPPVLPDLRRRARLLRPLAGRGERERDRLCGSGDRAGATCRAGRRRPRRASTVAVDPVLGRLVFATSPAAERCGDGDYQLRLQRRLRRRCLRLTVLPTRRQRRRPSRADHRRLRRTADLPRGARRGRRDLRQRDPRG